MSSGYGLVVDPFTAVTGENGRALPHLAAFVGGTEFNSRVG